MGLKPPCESSVKFILPAVRLLIAKRLVEKYGFTQTSAAKALGTTQAAISHYLRSKRGWKLSEKLMRVDSVRNIVEKIAEDIAKSKSPEPNVLDICQICKVIQKHIDELESLRV
ncbi:MAG: transcriptional regulator [Candidatus Bathyarchaeia archaeon]